MHNLVIIYGTEDINVDELYLFVHQVPIWRQIKLKKTYDYKVGTLISLIS